MAGGIRLKVFGPPGLFDGAGQELQFRTRKQLALLVYLHFEARSHPVARDGLADLLWPEASSDKGRHSLSQALSAVRARLGDGAVNARSETVGLVAPLITELDLLASGGGRDVVDVADPLMGLDSCAGADFAHWVDGAREQILSAARERLAAALRQARSGGDLAVVARQARLLHRVDPVNPAATIALAERALLDGDTIAAIRLLRDYLRRVEQELNTNPHPEIASLLRRLEHGGGPAIETSSPLAQMAQRRREVFVGRETELARLETLWQRSREESLVSCLVTGVAGIGKSSLVRRFATSVAARTNPVFVVTCQEIGGGIPFAAVSDMMLAIARDPAAGGTEPLWLAEASRVAPGLRAIYPGIPEPPLAPAESVRLRVAEALVQMIESAAEQRSVLIVFDDVQHMDPASRDVLFLFTRRLEQLNVVLLGTLRNDVGDVGGLSEVRADTLGWRERLQLEQLDAVQVIALIEELTSDAGLPHEAIRNAIAGLAQGNPYHAEMLVADWRQHAGLSLAAAETTGDPTTAAWEPPETMRLALARQFKGLSTDSQHVLHALAVAQRSLTTDEISGLLKLDMSPVERSVLELVERGFVRVDGGRFSFKNELHRAYVYYAMAVDARRYYHTRLGLVLWARRDETDFQWTLEASYHFIRAGMGQEAVDAVVMGAQLALTHGAPHEASRALQRLLQSCPLVSPPLVRLLLARALLASGDYAATLEALSAWTEDQGSPIQTAVAAGLRAEALHRGRLADDRAIIEAAGHAAQLAERVGVEVPLVTALQIQAEAAYDVGDMSALVVVRETANDVAARAQEPECRALAGLTRGFVAWAMGDLQVGSKTFNETAKLLEKLSLHNEYRRALNGLGMCCTGLGYFEEAVTAFRKAVAIAEHLGNPLAIGNTWANLAALYHDFGMFSDAVRAYQATLHSRAPSMVRVAAGLFADVARFAMELGNYSEAEHFCQECEQAADMSRIWKDAVLSLLVRADMSLSRSTPELAWPFVERAAAIAAGREQLVIGLGQYHRLSLHFLWATKGYEAVRPILREAATRCHKVMDVLEVRAMEEWIRSTESDERPAPAVARQIENARMFGTLALIVALGVRLQGIPERRPDESSAQLVSRLFPAEERVVVPTSVGLPE